MNHNYKINLIKLKWPLVLIISMLLLNINLYSQSWNRKGENIFGKASYENLGYASSISSDGNTLAVGIPYNSDVAVSSGQAKVYQWDGKSWVPKGAAINGAAEADRLGYSLSLSADGNTLALGAPEIDNPVIEKGHVQIYNWDGAAWHQKGADIRGAGLEFGWAVSLSADGNSFAASALGSSGDERVYAWDGVNWVQKGQGIKEEAANDLAGYAISLSGDGDHLAIGASKNSGVAYSAGHVRVFSWDGSDWVQQGLDIDGEVVGDNLGVATSLSADGNILAVGATFHRVNGTNVGQVKIYHWDGSGWILKADIDGAANYDKFGIAVSLSADGQTVAIGASEHDGNGFNSGHVRVYSWDGTDWVKIGNDINGDWRGEQSGSSVGLNGDGSVVVIGAPMNDGNATSAGKVSVYAQSGSVRTKEIDIPLALSYGPNPTDGRLKIAFEEIHDLLVIEVKNGIGQTVATQQYTFVQQLAIDLVGEAGLYFIEMKTADGKRGVVKVFKK